MAKITMVIEDLSDNEVDTKVYLEGIDELDPTLSPAAYVAYAALEAIRLELQDGGEVLSLEEEEEVYYTDNVLEFPEHKTIN